MLRISDIIRKRREELDLTQVQLARLAGTTQTTIDKIENGRSQRSRFLPAVAKVLGLDLAEIDPTLAAIPAPNASAPVPAPQLSQRQIPVYGVAIGGDDGRMKFNGERLDMVGCPPQLTNVPNAYAVYVSGDSMVPSFKPGQLAWVNPHLTARPGDDVIVQLHPEQDGDAPEGFIKELVKRTPSRLVVRQYNPAGEIEFDQADVLSVHVVVFASRRS